MTQVQVSEQNAYDLAIAAAKERFDGALGDAAEDALFISEKFKRPLQTVCKGIGGEDAWNAIRQRAQRLQSSRSGGVETRSSTLPPSVTRTARSAITRDPNAVADALSDEQAAAMSGALAVRRSSLKDALVPPSEEPVLRWVAATTDLARRIQKGEAEVISVSDESWGLIEWLYESLRGERDS